MGRWGFLAPELVTFAYALFTVVLILFTWTNLSNPQSLLWQRLSFLSGTIALWVVSLMWPCRLMMLFRVVYLLVMLGSWYPDTYELNSQFNNLDHIFASYEQDLFGFQPALVFSRVHNSALVSELMHMGYFSYYLFFVVTSIVVYFHYFGQFERVVNVIIASFFTCYVIYVFLPVTGPQYYYLAAGIENIEHANFPAVGKYFRDCADCLPSPGWSGGVFYTLCDMAHQAGERPTAAFPSSHVAVSTVVMLIVARMRMWRYLLCLSVPFLFLCLSTVYIQAHYAIDAIAGFFVGIMMFFLFGGMKLNGSSEKR
jgi:membrane-associated phospholipid phosphatase